MKLQESVKSLQEGGNTSQNIFAENLFDALTKKNHIADAISYLQDSTNKLFPVLQSLINSIKTPYSKGRILPDIESIYDRLYFIKTNKEETAQNILLCYLGFLKHWKDVTPEQLTSILLDCKTGQTKIEDFFEKRKKRKRIQGKFKVKRPNL